MLDVFLEPPRWLVGGANRDVVIAVRARLARCLSDAVFPWRAAAAEARSSGERICAVLRARWPDHLEHAPDGLDGDALRWFGERGWLESDDAAVVARSFHLLEGDDLAAAVNDIDHLRLSAWSAGSDITAPFARVRDAERAMEADLDWAAELERGYLCARTEDTGCGLRVDVDVFLPGIVASGMLSRVVAGLRVSGIRLASAATADEPAAEAAAQPPAGPSASPEIGRDGNPGDSSPYARLTARADGTAAEEEFLERWADALATLAEGERRTRERWLAAERPAAEDAAYRAFALLGAARRLSEAETHRLIAAARTGTACGLGPAPAPQGEMFDLLDRLRIGSAEALQRCLAHRRGLAAGSEAEAQRAGLVRAALARYHIG